METIPAMPLAAMPYTHREYHYMGEELGNYVHQNITVHTDPPARVLGHTQTDSNITVHTTPPVEFWDTHRQTE